MSHLSINEVKIGRMEGQNKLTEPLKWIFFVVEEFLVQGRRHRRASSGVYNKFGELVPATVESLHTTKVGPLPSPATRQLSY